MRYSIVAKSYERKDYFFEELRGLVQYPSTPIILDDFYEAGKAIAEEVARPGVAR
jgi:hypothetical protein